MRLPSSDRGALPLIAILITAFIATAVGTTVYVVKTNHGDNPGGFTLAVTHSTAGRTSGGAPTVAIGYEVDFQNDAAPQALQSVLQVRCTLIQVQLTHDRTFTGQSDVVAGARLSPGTVPIRFGDDDRGAAGAFTVSCNLLRDGAVLAVATGDKVTIPPPTGATPTPTPSDSGSASGAGDVDASDLGGEYRTRFERTSGRTPDCTAPDEHVFTVTPTGGPAVKVELDQVVVYEGAIAADLTFTTNAALYPGHADYYGPLVTQFVRDSAITMAGTLTTTDPACEFKFTATR